jgi:hypothetical protein
VSAFTFIKNKQLLEMNKFGTELEKYIYKESTSIFFFFYREKSIVLKNRRLKMKHKKARHIMTL